MTDSVQIWSPGFRVLDDSGDPIAGAIIKFHAAGTSTVREVFSDKGLNTSLGTEVTCDSSGVPQNGSAVDIVAYTNTEDYKVTICDASRNVVITVDNLAGALDTSNYLTTASPVNMPVQSKTSAYPMVAGDLGNVINCDASGGAFTLTLLAAATVGDGGTICIRKTDSSANAVTIDGNASETINGVTTFLLTRQNGSVFLVCDGSNWNMQASHNDNLVSWASTTTYATLSTATALDDTIPQNSEGDEIETVAHTASSTGASVLVEFEMFGVADANEVGVFAFFVDSTADAIYATALEMDSGEYTHLHMSYIHSPASTSSVTYKVRGGPSSGANNIDILGTTSARLFGGVARARLSVREL